MGTTVSNLGHKSSEWFRWHKFHMVNRNNITYTNDNVGADTVKKKKFKVKNKDYLYKCGI